jgi:hypothetical protein
MSKLEDESYLKRSRATWVAEKLHINFAKAHAIVQSLRPATPNERQKISKAVREDMRAPLHKPWHKK